jgi:hypothetical protein
MLVMLVEVCKGRAQCASFIQSVCSRREASLRQRKIPRSRVLSALLPQASIRVSNTLHRVLHNSTAAPTYLPVFTGRTWNRNGMRCRARSVVPGFGSPKSSIERRIRGLRLAIGRLSTCRRQIDLGLSSDIARTLSTCRPL